MSSVAIPQVPGTDDPPAGWRRRLAPAAVLVALTLIAYIPVYSAGFIWDDNDYVWDNPMLQRGLQGLNWIWTKRGATPQYYPLTHTSFWVEWQLWQADPRGYHVVNVLLHAASAVLLWQVLSRLGLRAAWLAAAVFALHPVHVESVAWITERKNTLSGMLYIAAMLCYVTGALRRDPENMLRPPRWNWYLAAVVLFAGAVLSKTVAGSLPAALLLILWWRSGTLPWRHIVALLPMLVFAAVMGRFTAQMEATVVGATGPEWDFSFLDRCLIAGRAVWFYAYKLVLPVNLIFVYPRWNIDDSAVWQYLFPLSAAAVVVALLFLRYQFGRGPLVAVLFFGGTLVPALGFVNVFPMRFSFVADHFQYHASIGLIVLGSELLLRVAGRAREAAAVLVVIVLSILTMQQARMYHDVETLWKTTLDRNPEAWMAHSNIAGVRSEQGRYDEAIWHLQRSIEIESQQHEAHVALGRLYRDLGQTEAALAEFQRGIEKGPGKIAPWLDKAELLQRLGRIAEAEAHFRKVLELNPRMEPARLGLAEILLNRRQVDEAIELYREGIEAFPESIVSRVRLGDLLMREHRPSEAIPYYEQALRLGRGDPEIQKRLNAARENARLQQTRDSR